MGLSCGSRLAKCILFVFNIIFWFTGACMLGVGIWFLVDDNASTYLDVATTDSDSMTGAAVVLVIVGLVIFITGGFGCMGACRESSCMLTTYIVLLVMLLILQVVAGIIAVVFKKDIIDGMEESLNDTMREKYGVTGNEGLTDAWDFVQFELECCGSTGPASWENTTWYAEQGENGTDAKAVPDTCCKLENDDYENPEPVNSEKCQNAARNPETEEKGFLHTQSCHSALEDWVVDHAGILIGMAFGLLVIQILGVMMACCLKRAIGNKGVIA